MRIVDFSPSRAASGATLTIRGEGFGALPSQNKVRLNGIPAGIVFSTPKELHVEVPKGPPCTGLVEVSVGDKTALSDKPFVCVPTTATVTTFVGGNYGIADGPGEEARFSFPAGLAIDAAGNLYVADWGNHRIRKITPQGEVSTLAGSGETGANGGGFVDGPPDVAQFKEPGSLALDATGKLYVLEALNIRVVSPKGVVSTLRFNENIAAGYSSHPLEGYSGILIDKGGNLYVPEKHRILKITPQGKPSTFAGDSTSGFADGPGGKAKFNSPRGLAMDAVGNLYVADSGNHRIRKITPSGNVSTFAGGESGHADGMGTAAQFQRLSGIAIDAKGNLYVTDSSYIRKISPQGKVSTLAGSEERGDTDGPGPVARFLLLADIAVDAKGTTLYVTDQPKNRIRKIVIEPEAEGRKPASALSILDFSPSRAVHGAIVSIRGQGFSAELQKNKVTLNGIPAKLLSATPQELKVEVPKNKLSTGPVRVSVGGKTAASAKPFRYVPRISVSTFAKLGKADYPWEEDEMAVDAQGNLYVTDRQDNRILKISPEGKVSTFAGDNLIGHADGPGNVARFWNPTGIALSPQGIVYVSEPSNHRIRKITPEGEVSTFAGPKRGSESGGSTAALNRPHGLAVDAKGNLYVADTDNHRICTISPQGEVSVFAGGSKGGLDGTGSAAQFSTPSLMTMDAKGNLYVADFGQIRKITPEGKVSSLSNFSFYNPADGSRREAWLEEVSGMAADEEGNLYISQAEKKQILKLSHERELSLLLKETSGGPRALAMDKEGNLYAMDSISRHILKITLE